MAEEEDHVSEEEFQSVLRELKEKYEDLKTLQKDDAKEKSMKKSSENEENNASLELTPFQIASIILKQRLASIGLNVGNISDLQFSEDSTDGSGNGELQLSCKISKVSGGKALNNGPIKHRFEPTRSTVEDDSGQGTSMRFTNSRKIEPFERKKKFNCKSKTNANKKSVRRELFEPKNDVKPLMFYKESPKKFSMTEHLEAQVKEKVDELLKQYKPSDKPKKGEYEKWLWNMTGEQIASLRGPTILNEETADEFGVDVVKRTSAAEVLEKWREQENAMEQMLKHGNKSQQSSEQYPTYPYRYRHAELVFWSPKGKIQMPKIADMV